MNGGTGGHLSSAPATRALPILPEHVYFTPLKTKINDRNYSTKTQQQHILRTPIATRTPQ
jgi:hypothetical protein